MKLLGKYLSLFLLCFFSLGLYASNQPIFVIAYNPTHQSFAQHLQRTLSQSLPSHRIQAKKIPFSPQKDTVIITLGKKAFTHILKTETYKNNPVFATFISSRDYYLTLQHEHTLLPHSPKKVSALFSDPSLIYQLRLSAALLQEANIAFIYDHTDQRWLTPLYEEAKKLQLPEPILIPLADQSIHQVLNNHSLAKADLLIASPNTTLYNSKNAKNIIFSLLDQKQGLIGYSSGWVNAGALATVYSSQEDITQELITLLKNWADKENALPKPLHPQKINIKLNDNIAKLLGITIRNTQTTPTMLREKVLQHAE